MFKHTLYACAVTLICAAPAAASTLTFTATSQFPNQSSDFSIVFDDADKDGLLSFDEVVSFSGFTSLQSGNSYSELLRVSPVPALTDEPQTFTSGGFAINSWLFGEGSDRTTAQPSSFTYAIATVPVPASALLLLAGLAGLAVAQRKRAAA
ncbi:MAG: VPLPA-CTERM sorting domain-containing protein [Pseudomonadota bacterium]